MLCCKGGAHSSCGCHTAGFRHFFTKEEERESLEEYKKNLQKEMEGVERRLEELQ